MEHCDIGDIGSTWSGLNFTKRILLSSIAINDDHEEHSQPQAQLAVRFAGGMQIETRYDSHLQGRAPPMQQFSAGINSSPTGQCF